MKRPHTLVYPPDMERNDDRHFTEPEPEREKAQKIHGTDCIPPGRETSNLKKTRD